VPSDSGGRAWQQKQNSRGADSLAGVGRPKKGFTGGRAHKKRSHFEQEMWEEGKKEWELEKMVKDGKSR